MGDGMSSHPPPIASWILERFVPERNREVVLGDLIEEYGLLAQANEQQASGWYWGQVVRSLPGMIRDHARGGAWLITLAVAVVAFFAAGTVEIRATRALAGYLSLDDSSFLLAGLPIGLASMLAASYVADRLRAGAATIFAVILGACILFFMVVDPDSAPLWYQITFLFLGPALAIAGGRLATRSRRNRELG